MSADLSARERLIETMARAQYESGQRSTPDGMVQRVWDLAPGDPQRLATLRVAERMLDAALALREEQDCPNRACVDGRVPYGLGSNLGERYTKPCPNCGDSINGRVSVSVLASLVKENE